jgi:serine/threonine-protein phosphatase 2A regulatory subunit A
VSELDQVLAVLGSKLGDLLPYFGGPEYAHLLVPIIEALCSIEETAIRTAASLSTKKILAQLNPANHRIQSQAYLELLRRLSNEETGDIFYPRASASQILPDVYRLLNDQDRSSVGEIYSRLIVDEIALVRRVAASSFPTLIAFVNQEVLSGYMLEALKSLLTDEHPSVKVIGIDAVIPYIIQLKRFGALEPFASELVPIVKNATEDLSWRVRMSISKGFGQLGGCFTSVDANTDIFQGAILLIQDPEPDVRLQALKEIAAFLPSIGPRIFMDQFIPIANQLTDDPTSSVRKTLAEISVDIASSVGSELTQQHLSPLILKAIADEDPLVRLRIIKKMPVIASDIPSLCSNMTSALKEAYNDPNWRVRKEFTRVLPAVVKSMGLEYFGTTLLSGYLPLLKDGVDEVRTAAAASVAGLAEVVPTDYVVSNVFPAVRSGLVGEYLVRLSMLSALEGLLKIGTLPESFQSDLLGLLVSAANDKVPNVRVRAAQVMGSVAPFIGAENTRYQLKPILTDLLTDKDKDVQYFASLSIKGCG